MSRPLRIEFEDALYHITSRGNRRERIFVDDTDRTALVDTIGEALQRFEATAFAYCLMPNHYHLVLRTHRANLSRLMRHINGTYAQAYNRRHANVGHLFQGRFNAILVQFDAYFLEVCRYVDLNPVRAYLVEQPHEWRWSSYRAHTGRVTSPGWLDSKALHRAISPYANRRAGAAAYVRFVSAGRGVNLWDGRLLGQIYLGDATFMQKMQTRTVDRSNDREIPRVQRAFQCPLEHYLDQADRNAALARAHLEGGHTQAAIARATGSSSSRISRLIARHLATSKT